MNTHDPLRQINYLSQVLSHDKKPIGLFLGAGCPTAIEHPKEKGKKLIPDIKGLTAHIVSVFKKNKHNDLFEKLYKQFNEDGKTNPNIEQILSHLRSLKQVCGNSNVRGLSMDDLQQLEKIICEEICEVMKSQLPNNETPYHSLSAWMSRPREVPVEIFTTNYDLLIEQALEETGIPYFDGFIGGREPFFDSHAVEEDDLPRRWARLWKLHGSINWCLSDSSNVVVRGFGLNNGEMTVVIHPSHLKYDESRRMPYLALLDKLKKFFKRPAAALIISGYSFGDDHINEVIIEGLKGNPTAIAFALLYGPINDYEQALKLASSRSNLSLLAENGAVIGTCQGKWSIDSAVENHTGISLVKENDEIKEVKFNLGDFKELGNHLVQLIGKEIKEDE